jgi:hypothetical protein
MLLTVSPLVFQNLFKCGARRDQPSNARCFVADEVSEDSMGKSRSGRTAFTLVVKGSEVKERKKFAPASKPMADARRKKPRRTDFFAEYQE